MKIKNKNLRKYKIKNFFFFKSKLEQEIKNRKKPEKSGKLRKNKKKIQKSFQISSQKIYHFLIDFHSLTHSLTPAGVPFPLEQSLILLGRIHASGHLSNNKELVHFHSQSTTKY